MQARNRYICFRKYRFERGKGAFSLSFIHREIKTPERLSNEQLPGAHKPNGHIWKRIHDQVVRNSLERTSRGRFLNISELNKQNERKSITQIQSDGALKVRNNYESFEMDPGEIHSAKTPYFLNVPKIRGVIYVTEGVCVCVCSLISYRGWRNSLCQAGCANSIAQRDEQLLLTLAELEHVDLFVCKMFNGKNKT